MSSLFSGSSWWSKLGLGPARSTVLARQLCDALTLQTAVLNQRKVWRTSVDDRHGQMLLLLPSFEFWVAVFHLSRVSS